MSMGKIYLWGPKDRALIPPHALKVNTTSTSTDFGQAFSPFMNQGPIELYGLTSHNVENMYKFNQVYAQHEHQPKEWRKWRDRGLADLKPHRYPLGKGVRPVFSYIKELGRLDRLQARQHIYRPAYRQKLERYCQSPIQTIRDILTITDVYLFDFDVYWDCQDPVAAFADNTRPAGHAYLIKEYIENG